MISKQLESGRIRFALRHPLSVALLKIGAKMLNFKTAITVFCGAIGILGATVSANAQISNMGVEAGMQVLNVKEFPSGNLIVPNVGLSQLQPTAASVNLTQSTTGIHVYSSMAFSSVTADSAIFDFSIGMNGNGWPGNVFGPFMGGLGNNGGHLFYTNVAPATWTVAYDLDVLNFSGSSTFGMNPITIALGVYHINLGGVTPTPGHYSGTQTFDVGAGTWHVNVGFSPNASGGSTFGEINAEYSGSITFNFGPVAAVPEPEIYAMMGMGLGLLGWVGRRRKQQAAA